jgi:hypothetical protein
MARRRRRMYVSYAGGLGLGLGSSDRARTSRPVLWGSQRAEHHDAPTRLRKADLPLHTSLACTFTLHANISPNHVTPVFELRYLGFDSFVIM